MCAHMCGHVHVCTCVSGMCAYEYHPLHHVLLTTPAEVDSASSQMDQEPHLPRTKILQNTGGHLIQMLAQLWDQQVPP